MNETSYTDMIKAELQQINSSGKQTTDNKHIIRGGELLQMEVEEVPMLFADLIPRIGLVAEVGASDTGKSMLYRQMAMSIVKGSDFLGFKYTGRFQNVIFVSTEDDMQATAFLLRKQNNTMKITIEQANRIRFVYDVDNVIEAIRNALTEEPADAVIIDAYSDVFTGKDSKDATQTRQFLNEYGKIAKDFGCCVAFLHHTGKRTEDLAPSKNNAVGSQSFEAKMRLMFEFRLDRERDDLRHLCIVKGNYIPAEAKKASYVLRMDENFCFSATGGRRPFELLAKDQPKEVLKEKKPADIDKNIHFAFLRKAAEHPITKTALNSPVCEEFGISDKTARKFVEYYINEKFLTKVESSKHEKYQFIAEQLQF